MKKDSAKRPVSKEKAQEVDGKLQELYNKQVKQQIIMIQQERLAKSWDEYVVKFRGNSKAQEAYAEKAQEARDKITEAKKKVEAIGKEMEPYNEEFQRAGGWSRAFLVTNKNGHVHRSMECSTTRSTTEFEWLTSYSGVDEDEIVAAAGEKACTECYPSAPVEVRSRPFTMKRSSDENPPFKPGADNVFGEDGKALKVPRGMGDFTETVKTEKQAYTKAVDTMIRRAQYKSIYGDRELDSEERRTEENLQQRERMLIGALARNHGLDEQELRKSILSQAQDQLERKGSPIKLE